MRTQSVEVEADQITTEQNQIKPYTPTTHSHNLHSKASKQNSRIDEGDLLPPGDNRSEKGETKKTTRTIFRISNAE